MTSGGITIDGTGGLGIAPQKNVLWDELTVEEHIRIFNKLKSPNNTASSREIHDLIVAVDLTPKAKAMSKTLSGGQKRKLQLGMMLTGGSAVCCVDEVSSGIDPLSRRKIWDILLAERGKRTIILTTHFLDEADLLADHIAILSKGTLRAQGSSVELKERLGAGYRVHVFNAREIKNPPEIKNVTRKIGFDVISYIAPTSSLAAEVIRSLESAEIYDYKFSNPTIEDVFLQVAEEVRGEHAIRQAESSSSAEVASDTQVGTEDSIGSELEKDSGSGSSLLSRFTQKTPPSSNDPAASDEEIANELVRVTSTPQESDGLRVLHLTKTFGKNTAVENVTFGVQHSEVFALLGPNGAGKSTTISLIRGDIQPSYNGGDVLVENTSVSRRRAEARSHLGVCPQFDAIDSMTVLEHLRFYARIRGIPDIDHNVRAVLRAVGLEAFSTRMAHALSGGNKRKLSLGIALMGNPSVVLLDEPSSGLDAAAKRIMWRTLHSIVPGRSILLTTHSMEEADALANRAGILAKRMLAMGTTENLRQRFGDTLHVHLVSKSAPHSTPEEMERVRQWVADKWPGAEIESRRRITDKCDSLYQQAP
ncbi:Retinal-specific ATP-binding cassette transporter [Daldinia childiae]|uniref:Retinal-specific ATP-binding cassette transporter n=1 Tax=Daldinia childiae TaxID=326645 RepID=UPI0014453D47|nr:Retinal-specific ATP-binding cassette transporter [Daldinia childiae]KAF3061699.1 Retinal-specific ATP-binding cassette transporter [Daldinia childiae]